jgi:citrate lyase alpha subunit
LTPDDIVRTTEDRLKQLTSAILRKAPIFLAMEENVIKMFDVKSFDYHSSESLCEQNNNEFI